MSKSTVDHKQKSIRTRLTGYELLYNARFNKDTAYTVEERDQLKLNGLLPTHIETIEEQVERCYVQFLNASDPLNQNIYLNALYDRNQTLFYRVVQSYIEQMLPIIYTPTIGDAVQNFSKEYRRARGLYLSYDQKHHLEELIDLHLQSDIKMVIMTDGEGVLGIGDWGVGGMDIAIGKMMVYVACSHINPAHVLPVIIDVGTNNETLLNSPNYVGLRKPRLTGEAYDEFIDQIITGITQKNPHIFFHFEDFGRNNARRLLDIYRQRHCVFNDDVQGTGLIALATIISATKIINTDLADHRFVILGPGTAGIGIADTLVAALMQRTSMSPTEAHKSVWLVGRNGIMHDQLPDIFGDQQKFVRPYSEVAKWPDHSLLSTIKAVKPTVLIGCSGSAGAFTEDCILEMTKHHDTPIIMPLSNPTSLSEATPVDIYKWTDGKALVATGSPFKPVTFAGKMHFIAQCNNAYIFPGLGMGVMAAQAMRLTENMLLAACNALSNAWFEHKDKDDSRLLPPLHDQYHGYSMLIAKAVMLAAIEDGVSDYQSDEVDARLEALYWYPEYYQFIPS